MLAMTSQKVELTVGQISLNSGIAFMVRLSPAQDPDPTESKTRSGVLQCAMLKTGDAARSAPTIGRKRVNTQ